MTQITINFSAIERHFVRPDAGGGTIRGRAVLLSRRIVTETRRSTAGAGAINRRTGNLHDSFRPVVHQDSRGTWRAGVRSDLKYASYLEHGTRRHVIKASGAELGESSSTRTSSGSKAPKARRAPRGRKAAPAKAGSSAPKWLVSNGPRSKGPNPTPLRNRQKSVVHPGNRRFSFMRNAALRAARRWQA